MLIRRGGARAPHHEDGRGRYWGEVERGDDWGWIVEGGTGTNREGAISNDHLMLICVCAKCACVCCRTRAQRSRIVHTMSERRRNTPCQNAHVCVHHILPGRVNPCQNAGVCLHPIVPCRIKPKPKCTCRCPSHNARKIQPMPKCKCMFTSQSSMKNRTQSKMHM